MTVLLIALGGAIGATSRYMITLLLAQHSSFIPWGTFAVNSLGCFIAGMAIGYFPKAQLTSGPLYALFLVGFLGSFTTFSAIAVDTLFLQQMSRYSTIAWHIAGNFLLSTSMVFLGNKIMTTLLKSFS